MNFKLTLKKPTKSFTLILPLAQDSGLTKNLKTLGATFGFNTSNIVDDFQAKPHQCQLIYNDNGNRIYLLGLGASPSFVSVQKIFTKWIFTNKTQLASNLHLVVDHFKSNTLDPIIEGIVQGVILGRYDVGLYKTGKSKKDGFAGSRANLIFLSKKDNKKIIQQAIRRSSAIATTQSRILDLMNAPSNKVKPETLAKWAKASGKEYGFKVTVFNKAQCKKNNLHALLAVNRGSEYPPAFIIMEYRPKNSGKKKLPKVGLVGKGVTFDTGGLSIKGATNMHYMKSDMGGAAAVMGTMEACAKLQVPVHLFGIVPTTDNCVDALAVKPGDVIDSYSGKTIEIIDTDAEGRLILADGLAYMVKNFKPEILIDLATLTGSSVRALGYHAGALFTNNKKLAEQLQEVGQDTGERLWPLPLWDDYRSSMDSDVADIKNLSGQPVAGAITAAKFLEFFTSDHPAWAHMDIAGVAFGNSILSTQKSATGYGIRLLTTYLERKK